MLVTSGCCRISSGCHLALFCGGCYIIEFIVHASSQFRQSTLIDHVSLLFPSVHSPSHSVHLSQSISFIFALFGCIHIAWSFNHIVSFTFQLISSPGIGNLRVSLDKFFMLDRYSLLEAELRWFCYSLFLCMGREIQRWSVAWVF